MIVDDLIQYGYAQTSLMQLFGMPLPRPVAELTAFAEQFATSDKVQDAESKFRRGESRGELKEFLCKLRDKRACEGGQVLSDAVGAFGMLPQIVHPIAAAARCKMFYLMSDLWYVLPSNDCRDRAWSQNWHRDPEGDCVIKVMIYFRDVDHDSGPLEYVSGSHTSYWHLVPPKSYPSIDIDKLIKSEDKVQFCVPAGTVLFVNTTGLHRGGYTRKSGRLSGVWTYAGAK